MRITLMGKVWKLVFNRRLRGHNGTCDDPEKPTGRMRTIVVHEDLKGVKRLEILLHEMLHACLWCLDESWVRRAARDMARTLWRLGYRLEVKEPE